MKLAFVSALAIAIALLTSPAPSMAAGPIVYQDVLISVHNNNDYGIAMTAYVYGLVTDRTQQVHLPPRQWTDIRVRMCCGHMIGFFLKVGGLTAKYYLDDYSPHVRLWVDTRSRNAHPDIPSAQGVRVKFYGNITEH